MGNSFSMLVITGIILMILCLLFKKPLLYLKSIIVMAHLAILNMLPEMRQKPLCRKMT